jgi:N-acetylglutamate synthase-like GNAT family acetyltransferase
VSKPVTIRPFEEQDASACRALWAELTRSHRALYDDASIGGDDPGSGFDDYLGEFAAARKWVAERGSTVIGFVGLIIRGKQGEIEPVVVSFDARGQGVGRSLVQTAVDAARAEGVDQLKASPVARNSHAIDFFHSLGFTALGHVDLLMDSRHPASYWQRGERLAGSDFEI